VTTPVLQLKNVSKVYPTTPPVKAVQNVDLTVEAGELLALVGPSGSGKSTMLHIMGTLDRPTSGEVKIVGHSVSDLSDAELSGLRSAHIGFVFQAFYLLTGYSALENVADGLLYTGRSLDDRRTRAREALTTVGLAHRLEHVATQLSGGERQRVAIARAIVGEHSLVLADEPTGNLDTQTSAGIVDLLHDLNRAGTTIVVVTHDLEIAESLPRIVRLRDGSIESDRTKKPV
jgi:putative ABC transport system ATP-binding protein